MTFTLPPLPYANDALEPYIDAQTMEIHHGRHHQAYVDNANKALESTDLADKDVQYVVRNLGQAPKDKQGALRNNAGGHLNHSLFWESLTNDTQGGPSGELADAINRDFGSLAAFKTAFEEAAKARFGSGWAWLVLDAGTLKVVSTANQDNPLMHDFDGSVPAGVPLLGVDVWEHAYYLKYQNKRPEYLAAFWNVVDWDVVARRHSAAK